MLRRSMSGNSGLNNLAMNPSSGVHFRRSDQTGGTMMGLLSNNNTGASTGGNNAAYRASLVSHFAEDLDRRRRQERMMEDGRSESMALHVILA